MTTKLKTQGEAINALANVANSFVITDQKDMGKASEMLTQANKYFDSLKNEEKKFVDPIKLTLKQEQDRWKPFKKMAEDVIVTIRKEMSRYQTEEVKRAEAEKKKIADRAMKGTLRIDTADRKIQAVDTPDVKVTTESGNTGFRKLEKVRIVSVDEIPREYMVPDEAKIKAALIAGIEIPGTVLDFELTPINRRN